MQMQAETNARVNYQNANASACPSANARNGRYLISLRLPRWRPPPPSLISFPESSFPDCWSRVARTLGTRLPPSSDTKMRVRISFSLRFRLTCERCLRLFLCLRLRLCRTCVFHLTKNMFLSILKLRTKALSKILQLVRR